MCGIAGALGADAERLTRTMSAALIHRGPDADGLHVEDGVALGFRRLSIVDLQGGNQPIFNETGDVALICNGEIYNSATLRKTLEGRGHRLRTRCDVEVILHLYEDLGPACVRELRGMFAFAIWDRRQRTLLLARDHLGQKPLFFFADGERFLFASEIQALMATGVVPRRIDLDALWHYLALRCLPDQLTMIGDVRKLPPATVLQVPHEGPARLARYWEPSFEPKRPFTEHEAVDALDACLQDSVRAHLQSDVQVGTFLSGGIDSTTLAVMASRDLGTPLPAFSIGVDDASFDELDVAASVAAAEGMRFHGERAQPDLVTLLPMMVHHLGEPADPYAVGTYLVSRLAAGSVKVALSGDGGDELFGGYDRYLGQRLVDYYCLLPAALRRAAMTRLLTVVPETNAYKSLAQKLRWLQALSEVQGAERYTYALGALRFTPAERAGLFHPDTARRIREPDTVAKVVEHFEAADVQSLTDRMLRTDLMTRVPDHNLVMGDRMSMACSLEVRNPFLDVEVVALACALPAELKVKGRRLKHVLRQVARRYLPEDVVSRPKQGFGFPIGQWLRHELKALVTSRLEDSRLVAGGIFRPEPVRRLLDEHMTGRVDHSYRLWLLLNLEIWHSIYLDGEPVKDVQADVARRAAGGRK